MTENFDSFNAPQFFDFSKDLHKDENVDSYFEIDHENIASNDPSEDPLDFTRYAELKENNSTGFYSPVENTPVPENKNGYKEDCNSKELSRSISVDNLKLLCDAACKEIEENGNCKEDISTSHSKLNESKSTSTGYLKKTASSSSLTKIGRSSSVTTQPHLIRTASRENLNRLAQPKRYGSAQNLSSQDNYVPMAEAVKRFQNGTPARFRTTPSSCGASKLGNTIPQSPALLTKNRHRPVHALTREQQELADYEEAQKFKIKAHPLNKKILQGPIKPVVPIDKKPPTVIEPFKITAPRKIVQSPRKQTVEFHAKPAPRAIYEPPKLKEVRKISLTKPATPTFMRRTLKEPAPPKEAAEEPKPPMKLTRTVPVPFSFEQRDKIMQKKREEHIKKVLEEEKKAREFHARPIPEAILKSAKSSSNLHSSNSSESRINQTKSEENLSLQFKARPATVLHKKPFEPKKERHLIEISEFQLNTVKRAKEREEFEKLKAEKEERIALLKQEEEKLQKQKEEEEVARLRKESEYKAHPVRKYKEVKIQPMGKVTEPKSPNFHTDRLRNKANKENVN